jgi:hypothetical protein
MFGYSGPYRILAEFQLKQFGSYSSKLTMLAICIAFLLLGELSRMLLQGAERPVPGIPIPPSPSAPARATLSLARVAAHRRWILAGIPFAMGAYFFLTAMSAGSLRELRIRDVADGTLPARTVYAEVRGYADEASMAENNYLYVPMRETADAAVPVTVVVGVDQNKVETEFKPDGDGLVAVRGMLEPQLDSEIRYAFEKHGTPLANPCRVLRTNRTPASDEKMGAIFMLGSLGIGGGLWVFRLFQQKLRVPRPGSLPTTGTNPTRP